MTDSYSLVAQERNVQEGANRLACAASDDLDRAAIAFRHSGWQSNRTKIREALERTEAPASRLAAWDACGADAWVLRSCAEPERLRICSSTCKDRFCVPCADTRSARIGRRVRDRVPAAGISFLTLTLADANISLADGISKLLRCFRKLRRWSVWLREVAGGAAFLEVKWNAKLERWHPHLHAVCEAGYVQQRLLSAEWDRLTCGSYVVHIKRPSNAETVIRYVCKYGSKALDQSFVADPQRLDEAIRALKGRHLCLAFGEWRNWALTDEDDEDGEEWQPIGRLATILDRERRGDPDAKAIMEKLRCMTRKQTTSEPNPRAPPVITGPERVCQLPVPPTVRVAVTSLLHTLG